MSQKAAKETPDSAWGSSPGLANGQDTQTGGCLHGPAPTRGLAAPVRWDRIKYGDLTAKQKEAYNFAKLSALLADYGFSCTRVVDDDKGPDLVAYHAPSGEVLRVQQKSALSVHRVYEGKGLWITFHVDQVWYLLEHDWLRDIVDQHTNMLNTATAGLEGRVFTHRPSKRLLKALEPYRMS